MLTTQTIKSASGNRKKAKRVGRGNGSGKGTFCTRGMNGQNSRSGGGVPDWFEGGQTPLFRRMPKLKGFSNARFKKHFNIINLSDVEYAITKWAKEITHETLLETGVITRKSLWVKLLWNGELKSKISITVDVASASAIAAIEKAWGTLTTLSKNVEEK
jgi:large subunit ribosomal protein L15